MIYDLLQDKKGFLWFATKDGLNRYDGYNFRVYHHDPFDPFSMAGNEIQALFEDHLGRIWIGTVNNGADVFDPQTGRFYHLGQGTSQNVGCFAETPDGSVWIGTGNGANRVQLPAMLPADQPDLQTVARVDTYSWDNPQSPGLLPPNHVGSMVADQTGKLWVSTNLQVGCFDPATGQFKTVFDDLRQLSTNGDVFAPDLFRGPDGTVWIAHPDQLLHIRDGGTDAFPFPERSVFPQTDLAFDAAGKLYISTRKQIFTLSPAAMQTPAQARFESFYRFPPDGIIGTTKLLIDRGGLLWIGTNGYGLRKYNPGDRHFQHFAPSFSLRRIATDAQGRTWVWRSGGKFQRLDENENRLAEPLLEEPALLQHDCLADRNGTLWLLCENRTGRPGIGTLIKVNPLTLRPEARYPLPSSVFMMGQFMEDRAGKLRIIGGENRLTTFDPQQATFETADFSTITGFKEINFCLYEDVAGYFWIGTPHGLVRGIPGPGGWTFSVFKNNPADRKSLNCDVVLATHDDLRQPDRYLWVGTRGGGLNRLDKTTGECRHFTTADGLPNNVVYAIIPDSSGNLWLSTNCGLAKFDPASDHFQNFYAADGLQDNEFNTISYARSGDGRLFFGGVNGLTAFYPEALTAATVAPSVYLTGLKIQNHATLPGDGVLEKSIEATTAITLTYDQNQLSFEFAAMDFSAPQQNQYRYRLLGTDHDWLEPTTANSATYANLAPGKYVFEVQTGGSHGAWNGQPARLEILILPPWWKTSGAYLLYFVGLALGSWTFYRFQINKLRLKEERAFEHREAERLADLDRLKTNFFSSVTHEFRTPLTLMLEPTRQLLLEAQDQSQRYRLELIEKNSRRLLRYVNQLLDLSKLEAGQMPLDLRPDSPVEALQSVVETFLPLAVQKGIALEVEIAGQVPTLIFDREKLEQIIFNLLSNALKFTAKGGHVRVALTATSHLRLQVTDTGIGIPEAVLPMVFNRFYQVGESAAQGTGIGLALTKELVEHMGGSISVDSRTGQGTTFEVLLPVQLVNSAAVNREASKTENPTAIISPPIFFFLEKQGPELPADANQLALVLPVVEKNPLLLLVEDDDELRQFLRASLPAHFRIAEAANGAEGIRMALELIPDLVISDLMMPEKNGFEVCDALKNDARSSHIPLILLTAKSTVESKIQGLRQGADAYLTKPFRADELVAHIESLIATRRHLQGVFSKAVAQQSVQESVATVFQPRENEFLQQLISVVEANLDNEAMDAKTFSRSVFMSRSQLHRKISALTGLPLTEFVRNYRLDRARDMLAGQEGSITEIAWKTGFSNAKYFSTCFRERFGQSPSLFRAGIN